MICSDMLRRIWKWFFYREVPQPQAFVTRRLTAGVSLILFSLLYLLYQSTLFSRNRDPMQKSSPAMGTKAVDKKPSGGQRYLEVAAGYRLTIVAAGGMNGNVHMDATGAGGLGALKSYVIQRKNLSEAEGGGFLLLYSGDLLTPGIQVRDAPSLEGSTVEAFQSLPFQAMAIPAKEWEVIQRKQMDLPDSLPLVDSWLTEKSQKKALKRDTYLPVSRQFTSRGYRFSIFALGYGTGDRENFLKFPQQLDTLADTMGKKTVEDLLVILSAESTSDNLPDDLFEDSQIAEHLLGYHPDEEHPIEFPRNPTRARKTLILRSGVRKFSFHQLESGAYQCSFPDRGICELTLEYRKHMPIAVNARFFVLNGKEGSPLPYYPGQ